MARALSLKQRVVWTLTGAVAFFVGLLAVLAFMALHEQEDELSNAQVRAELQRIVAQVAAKELQAPVTVELGPHLRAYVSERAKGGERVPQALRGLLPGLHELEIRGQTWHVAMADLPSQRVTVALDATASEDRVRQFGVILAVLWVACTVAAGWLARSVASVVVGPMLEVTRRIANGMPGGQGLPVARNDEAGLLIEAFNRFQDRVDESINREREFAANLNHEIRTPLTAIRTDAEIIAMEPGLSDALQSRLERIVSTVDDIVATSEATRAIHAPQAQQAERTVLRTCVLDGWNGMADRAAAVGLQWVDQMQPEEAIDLDRYALLTVVRNLIRNAIDHAAPATLTVSGGRAGLRFCDDGPGIAADDLPYIFDRYRSAKRSDLAGGGPLASHGLGLAIAQRICDVQGWQLSVTSSTAPDSHGTCFLLRLGSDWGDG